MLTWGRLSDEQQMIEAKGLLEYWKYTEAYVQGLVSDPPDNYVGDLIRVCLLNEHDLSIHEITNVVYGLLIAGHETTTSMSANAIVTLMRHREAWDRLCADPALIPNAVEELVRVDSSVITWRRKALTSVEVAGVRIPEGAKLLLALCSGNRDDAQFPNPERLDLERDNAKAHLSFGFGIHYCLGAPLARLELKVILEELTQRLPSLRLVAGQPWEFPPNTSFRGPASLWVEWRARARLGRGGRTEGLVDERPSTRSPPPRRRPGEPAGAVILPVAPRPPPRRGGPGAGIRSGWSASGPRMRRLV
jgi:cytochrome P450